MASIKREIYEVHIGYVNENGNHAADPAISGQPTYPIVVDSRNNNDDLELTLRKAKGYLGKAEEYLANRSDHQVDYCYIVRVSDGKQIELRRFGKLADIVAPDPEPEPEPTPEPEQE